GDSRWAARGEGRGVSKLLISNVRRRAADSRCFACRGMHFAPAALATRPSMRHIKVNPCPARASARRYHDRFRWNRHRTDPPEPGGGRPELRLLFDQGGGGGRL